MRRSTGLAAVAGGLAAAWLANHLVARAAERRHPPVGRFLTVDGVRLHYLAMGPTAANTPPIVLLHGNGGSIDDFLVSGLADRLARTHRVIAFDRPGFGYTTRPRRRAWTAQAQADLIHRALAALRIERPILVGHSWGTLVALAIALDHPSDLAALALLSGPLMPEARPDIGLAKLPGTPLLGDLLIHTVWPLLGRLIWSRLAGKLFEPAAPTDRFTDLYPIGLALRPGQLRAGAADLALMATSVDDLSRRVGELSVPVVTLTGTGDAIVDPQRHALPFQQIVGGELCLVAGAGHMVHHTEPGLVADAIEALSQQVRLAKRSGPSAAA